MKAVLIVVMAVTCCSLPKKYLVDTQHKDFLVETDDVKNDLEMEKHPISVDDFKQQDLKTVGGEGLDGTDYMVCAAGMKCSCKTTDRFKRRVKRGTHSCCHCGNNFVGKKEAESSEPSEASKSSKSSKSRYESSEDESSESSKSKSESSEDESYESSESTEYAKSIEYAKSKDSGDPMVNIGSLEATSSTECGVKDCQIPQLRSAARSLLNDQNEERLAGADYMESSKFSNSSQKHDRQAEVTPDIGNINIIIHTSSKSNEHESEVAPTEKLEKEESRNVSAGTVSQSSKSSNTSSKSKIHHHQTEVAPAKQLQRGNSEDVFTGTDYKDLPSSNSSKFSNTSSKSKKYDHQIEVALAEQFPREKSENISNGTDYSYKDSLSSLFDTLFNSSSKSNHDQQAGVAPGEKLENVSTVTDNMGYLQSFAFEFFNTSPKSKKHDQQPEVGPEDNVEPEKTDLGSLEAESSTKRSTHRRCGNRFCNIPQL